jgi:hypothetical protein
MTRRPTSRRSFLKGSLSVAAGSLIITGTKASGDFRGANEAIRIAIAGINGRGGSHMKEFGAMKDVRIAYLVDPDSRLYAAKVKSVENQTKTTPKTEKDIRRGSGQQGSPVAGRRRGAGGAAPRYQRSVGRSAQPPRPVHRKSLEPADRRCPGGAEGRAVSSRLP